MKIYLAGQNGMHSILEEKMILYLAGGVSGNLKPAWKRMAQSNDISQKGFLESLKDENFWQGGSLGIGYTRLRR